MTHGIKELKLGKTGNFLAVFDKFDGFKNDSFIWGFEIWRKNCDFIGFRILHGTNI